MLNSFPVLKLKFVLPVQLASLPFILHETNLFSFDILVMEESLFRIYFFVPMSGRMWHVKKTQDLFSFI